jgi:hypothetical protein
MLNFSSSRLFPTHPFLVACGLRVLTSWCQAVEPEVVVQVDPTRIFLGESVQYEVLLNHCDPDQQPQLEGWKRDFTFELLERTTVQQTSIRMQGRQTIRQEIRGPRYTYRLTPLRPGTILIPSPRVEVKGETFQGPSVTLEVIAPPEQDIVRLSITTTPARVYPLHPFTVSLNLDLRSLSVPDEEVEPLANQRSLPTLSIPWVDDEQLAKGLQPLEPWERWLQTYRRERNERRLGSLRGSVSINGLQRYVNPLDRFFADDQAFGLDEAFDPFAPVEPRRREQDQRIAFRVPPVRVRLPDDQGRETNYWRYRFSRRFAAHARGTYRFGPATFKGDRTDYAPGSDSQDELLYALAEPLEIVLAEPPRAGRPASYTGAIGRFTCGAELTPTQAEVGQPLTLTVSIQGTGTLDETFAPQLDGLPELKGAFRIYEPTAETVRDQRRFTYRVRPLQSLVTEFPSLAWSYFDVDAEQYVTLRTPAIPLQLRRSSTISEAELAAANQPDPPNSADESVAADDSRRSPERPGGSDPTASSTADRDAGRTWTSDRFTPRVVGSLLVLGCLVLMLVILFVRGIRIFFSGSSHQSASAELRPQAEIEGRSTSPVDIRPARVDVRTVSMHLEAIQQRRAQAGWRAEQRLGAALADRTDASRVVAGISAALVGWVADTADLSAASLTTAAATEQLTALRVPAATISRFEAILQQCDDIRFGARKELHTLDTEAELLLSELLATCLPGSPSSSLNSPR